MILFPAIDLKDGQVVRLMRGDMNQATVYHHDAVAQARHFQQMGFEWLHVVDLNGAFAGNPVHVDVVKKIVDAVQMPVQLGGGIRTMGSIAAWMEAGVQRIVLGTIAMNNPVLVREACKLYAGRIAIGIDSRDGYVATEGWGMTTGMKAVEMAQRLEDAGAAAIIFTDISRDGAKAGVNIEATTQMARAVTVPIIASGGVSGLEDLRALQAIESEGVVGVISGRAIYDGSLDVPAALELFRQKAA